MPWPLVCRVGQPARGELVGGRRRRAGGQRTDRGEHSGRRFEASHSWVSVRFEGGGFTFTSHNFHTMGASHPWLEDRERSITDLNTEKRCKENVHTFSESILWATARSRAGARGPRSPRAPRTAARRPPAHSPSTGRAAPAPRAARSAARPAVRRRPRGK